MKSLITTTLIIAFSVMNPLSQDLSGVWHGITKTPDNKEIRFVFPFEKNEEAYNTIMAVHPFDVSDIKPKTTTFKNELLSIDSSNIGTKDNAWVAQLNFPLQFHQELY
jgi:hypothetical protein